MCVKFNVNDGAGALDKSQCEPGYHDMDEPTEPTYEGIPHGKSQGLQGGGEGGEGRVHVM